MPFSRRAVAFFAAAFLLVPTVGLFAQPSQNVSVAGPQYTSIVVFGDSLSDSGNVTYLSTTKFGIPIPGPFADYTYGRFTDGTDTTPAASAYTGVWVEQLSSLLPNHPTILDSLSGGNNYAYGYAFTGQGTTNLVFSTSPVTLSVNVNNIGLQISNYLATHPAIDNKTLFVLWGGANDLLNAVTQQDIITAATNQGINLNDLIKAGATQFLIPNLPPLGGTPRINGTPSYAVLYNEASAYYNRLLAQAISIVEGYHKGQNVAIYQLDVYSLFNQVLSSPGSYGLSNVTASSQGLPVNPDTYLFWDSIHPTTHGHNIIANSALQTLNAPPCASACPGVAAAH